MDTHNSEQEFRKLLEEIMSHEPKPHLSEEEIHFDVLAMKVMQLVGDDHVVWLD